MLLPLIMDEELREIERRVEADPTDTNLAERLRLMRTRIEGNRKYAEYMEALQNVDEMHRFRVIQPTLSQVRNIFPHLEEEEISEFMATSQEQLLVTSPPLRFSDQVHIFSMYSPGRNMDGDQYERQMCYDGSRKSDNCGETYAFKQRALDYANKHWPENLGTSEDIIDFVKIYWGVMKWQRVYFILDKPLDSIVRDDPYKRNEAINESIIKVGRNHFFLQELSTPKDKKMIDLSKLFRTDSEGMLFFKNAPLPKKVLDYLRLNGLEFDEEYKVTKELPDNYTPQ